MYIEPKEIDDLIKSQYTGLKKTTELYQLSRLFSPSFIEGLISIIQPKLADQPHYKQELEISLCWIDKRPLADFAKQKIKDHNNNVVTKKVEIADAAFYFFTENGLCHKGQEKITNVSSLSLLFQAKRASSKNPPVVPVGRSKSKNNSTAKELALLSSWPKFDLYKTSGNKSPIYDDIEITYPHGTTPPFGWFGVCPPTKSEVWKSRWMCGPSKLGSKCEHTLGELLSALLQRTTLGADKVHSGKEFNFDSEWVSGQKLKGESPWDVLNNEILSQCKSSILPKSIFTTKTSRCVSIKDIICLDKYMKLALLESDKAAQCICKKFNTRISSYISQSYIPDNFSDTVIHGGAMPVLIFSIKSMEKQN